MHFLWHYIVCIFAVINNSKKNTLKFLLLHSIVKYKVKGSCSVKISNIGKY